MKTTKTPQFQSFDLETVNHVSPNEAFKAITEGTAIIIDVRELSETYSEYIPHRNVLYHPMSVIMNRLVHIPTDKMLIVACTHGERSVKVANLFILQEFENVVNLDGGLEKWKSEGLPCEQNLASSCGCGCSSSESEVEPESGCGGCSGGCC